jgi:hypothetical protein
LTPHLPRIHTRSIRLASGAEALVTRVVAEDGRIGYGYSLKLDATESRHMAESNALPIPPEIQARLDAIDWEDK